MLKINKLNNSYNYKLSIELTYIPLSINVKGKFQWYVSSCEGLCNHPKKLVTSNEPFANSPWELNTYFRKHIFFQRKLNWLIFVH